MVASNINGVVNKHQSDIYINTTKSEILSSIDKALSDIELQKQHLKNLKKNKKKLFFNLDNTQTIENTDEILYADDIIDRWYSAHELRAFKDAAKDYGDAMRKQSEQCPGCISLATAHKKSRFELNAELEPLMQLTFTRPDEDLHQWCAYEDGRRGIERYVSFEYALWLCIDVNTTRRVVLEEQAKLQQTRGVINEECIARVSEELTRRARDFAIYMGAADEYEACKCHQLSEQKNVLSPQQNNMPTLITKSSPCGIEVTIVPENKPKRKIFQQRIACGNPRIQRKLSKEKSNLSSFTIQVYNMQD